MSRRCSTSRSYGRGGSISPARRRHSSPVRCSCSRWSSPADAATPCHGRGAHDRQERSIVVTCDALVVGGGPGGSSCAWQLRQAGLDVIVVDAQPFPRDKVCAGWITPQVVSALRLDVQEYARSRTWQPFTGFRVGTIHGGDATAATYDRPVSFGIRRCEFDHYLLERSGAALQLGTSVTNIRMHEGQWIVNDAIRAPMLVGAGGSRCPVARMLGGANHGRPQVVAQEVESAIDPRVAASLAVEPEVPELFSCRAPQGDGGCVRKGEYANVGLGRLDPGSLPAATSRFVAFLEARHRIPPRLPWRWRGHAYAVNAAPRRNVVDAGVLLVGDAAGVAGPQSGEGIPPAGESRLLASRPAIQAPVQRPLARLGP